MGRVGWKGEPKEPGSTTKEVLPPERVGTGPLVEGDVGKRSGRQGLGGKCRRSRTMNVPFFPSRTKETVKQEKVTDKVDETDL